MFQQPDDVGEDGSDIVSESDDLFTPGPGASVQSFFTAEAEISASQQLNQQEILKRTGKEGGVPVEMFRS